MSRWFLAAVAAVVLVGTGALLGCVWLATEGEVLRDRISAVSAIGQVASAFIIVALTAVLAWVAFGALAAARAEAGAAAEAVGEARRSNLEVRVERELSVLPFVAAEANPTVFDQEGHLGLEVRAHNYSSHAALRVTAILLTAPWDLQPPSGPDARAHLLRDSPHVQEAIAAGGGRSFNFQVPLADFGDEIVVRLQYSGVLGANVWQTYILRPRDTTAPEWFVQMERYVQPLTYGAEPIVTRHPSVASWGTVIFRNVVD